MILITEAQKEELSYLIEVQLKEANQIIENIEDVRALIWFKQNDDAPGGVYAKTHGIRMFKSEGVFDITAYLDGVLTIEYELSMSHNNAPKIEFADMESLCAFHYIATRAWGVKPVVHYDCYSGKKTEA